MSNFPGPLGYQNAYVNEYDQQRAGILSRFFNQVYAWMAAGLALTAVVAWFVSTQPDLIKTVLSGPVLILCIIGQLVLVFTVSAAINRISATTATLLFMLYAALNGLTLSVIFLVYAHSILASAFVVSAGTFAVMSVYGHLTKTDLSRLGSLLMMGLIGVVIASVVSIFWHNSMLQVIINYVGVAVFIGLTAYDTQKLQAIAYQTAGNAALSSRLAVSGALMLYLDFINLFLFILRILGDRQR